MLEGVVKKILCGFLATLLLVATVGTSQATPTGQIWIPSTDVQTYLTGRFEIDNYFRASGTKNATGLGSRDPNIMDFGITAGVLPFKKLQMEIGFDYLVIASDPNDQHPWSGNFKLATPEDSLFTFSPAIAVGLYNARPVKDIATRDAPSVNSGQNILYALVAKTVPAFGSLPSLGRVSAGYYRGAKRALVDNPDPALAKPANDGVLLSWDRTMKEITDKLWLGVDYQGGDNVSGAFNVGASWNFTDSIQLLLGYDMYIKKNLAGSNTFTTQVNFTFP
jgi:hypothetical protein